MKTLNPFTISLFLLCTTAYNLANGQSQAEQNEVVDMDFRCLGCKWAAQVIIDYHQEGARPERLFKILSVFCSFLGGLDKQVCQGMIYNVGEQLFAILDVAKSSEKVTAMDICGMALGGTCAHKSKRLYKWTLDIPDLNNEPLTPPPVWPKSSNNTYKILHLSDPHVQLDYTVGSSTDCGQFICCSSKDPPPTNPAKKAGQFGDYHCDLPLNTLNHLLAEARNAHPEIKYIFLTGDYPAHDVWRQDREHNLESAKAIVKTVTDHFPGVQVYPAIGNHEIFPVNMFPSEDQPVPKMYDPAWLYNNLADLYQHWLPGPDQQQTLRDSGYYSILANPTLRILSINANFCNNFNFWLLLNFNDPHHHLHWLYRQLHKAEFNKERVFILGHIAPGTHSCLGKWSHEYNRLIKRFKNVVIGQFFGHTHHDEFQVFFNGTEPINMAYLAPSETSVDGLNPAFRIYELDADSNLLLNHETYYFKLDQANKNGYINVTKEYNTKTDLNLEDMSPKSWHDYVKHLARDENAFQQFRAHYYRSGPALNPVCDTHCKKNLLCDLLTSEAQLTEKPKVCQELPFMQENNIWWFYSWINKN